MKSVFVATVVGVMLLPMSAGAHRLDEYLQATRISLGRDVVAVDIDLTPGVNIASGVLALVDRDGDGTISPEEAAAYGRAVAGDLILQLDARAVPLTVIRVDAASTAEMREGVGTIHVRASAVVEMHAGGHQVYFRNDHRPAGSVYLVNALVPDDRDVVVVSQTRHHEQRTVRIDYGVGSRWRAQLLWVLPGVGGLVARIGYRRMVHGRSG